jgi:hypothetical protein
MGIRLKTSLTDSHVLAKRVSIVCLFASYVPLDISLLVSTLTAGSLRLHSSTSEIEVTI